MERLLPGSERRHRRVIRDGANRESLLTEMENQISWGAAVPELVQGKRTFIILQLFFFFFLMILTGGWIKTVT